MAKKIIKAQMKQRRDTLENWAAVNPVLLDGELGFIEGFNDRFKVGDGKTAWNDLSYFSGSFDPSGTYPDLTAGDLAGRGESVPAEFGFRASGGKSIKDGRAYIKRIKGNSVVWNQLCKSFANADVKPKIDYTFLDNGGVSVSSWTAYEPFRFNVGLAKKAGHRFLLMAEYTNTSSTKSLIFQVGTQYITKADEKGTVATIGTIVPVEGNTFADYIAINTQSVQDGIVTIQGLRFIDLTQMFGAGNEPTTIEDFNARVATLGIDMYAYNEGQVIHCNTESIKSVGDNAWDEQWENGTINVNTGDNIDAEYAQQQIRSKNLIRVLPNEDYYIALPQYLGSDGMWVFFYDEQGRIIEGYNGGSGEVAGNASLIRANDGFMHTASNASYIKFYMVSGYGSTYNHDILISLYHSGWKAQKDDQYQPYWQDILPLPIIRNYFRDGMKKAGSAHDEIRYNKASGKWEAVQRIGSVDLRNVADIKYNSEIGAFYFVLTDMRSPTTYEERATGFICSRYNASNNVAIAGMPDKTMLRFPGGYIYIKDSAYTDVESFKAMLQEKQVKLYYELAEPIVTEITEDFRDYYNVADFGTEMSQSNVPSAAFSADIIYQFNAVDMIREHEMEINELQDAIKAMQAQLTSLINK